MAKRLKTAVDLRRYLANLINRVESGEIETDRAGKLGYLANILLRVIEHSDLEERIEKLEKQLSEPGPTSINESYL
jgi:hypothetical protein